MLSSLNVVVTVTLAAPPAARARSAFADDRNRAASDALAALAP